MEENFYTSYHLNPLGTVEIKATNTHIVSLSFVEKIAIENPNKITQACSIQLDEYFEKKRTVFDLPLQLEGTEFQEIIWSLVQKIPFGRTATYKDLAVRSGKKETVRAVGAANGKNPILLLVPCHRVIGADGALVGYSGELWRKKWLLEFEQGDKNGKQLGLVY